MLTLHDIMITNKNKNPEYDYIVFAYNKGYKICISNKNDNNNTINKIIDIHNKSLLNINDDVYIAYENRIVPGKVIVQSKIEKLDRLDLNNNFTKYESGYIHPYTIKLLNSDKTILVHREYIYLNALDAKNELAKRICEQL